MPVGSGALGASGGVGTMGGNPAGVGTSGGICTRSNCNANGVSQNGAPGASIIRGNPGTHSTGNPRTHSLPIHRQGDHKWCFYPS
ncbi:MAG TPA: hypothetical protein VEH06_02730 [Candidatus Bathyarchaeia archaeon]|nr:hypothetical protein [Candidatus Bathyarchaeia archaeon]